MDAQTARFPGRLAPFLMIQALVVQAVSGFMEDAVQGRAEVVFVVAGGESGVERSQSGAEWMGGGIDAAGGEIESDGGGDLAIKRLLGGYGVMPGEQRFREAGGFFRGGLDHGGDLRAQGGEGGGYFC